MEYYHLSAKFRGYGRGCRNPAIYGDDGRNNRIKRLTIYVTAEDPPKIDVAEIMLDVPDLAMKQKIFQLLKLDSSYMQESSLITFPFQSMQLLKIIGLLIKEEEFSLQECQKFIISSVVNILEVEEKTDLTDYAQFINNNGRLLLFSNPPEQSLAIAQKEQAQGDWETIWSYAQALKERYYAPLSKPKSLFTENAEKLTEIITVFNSITENNPYYSQAQAELFHLHQSELFSSEVSGEKQLLLQVKCEYALESNGQIEQNIVDNLYCQYAGFGFNDNKIQHVKKDTDTLINVAKVIADQNKEIKELRAQVDRLHNEIHQLENRQVKKSLRLF